MGFYLNSKKARSNYQEIVNSAYFVDKTLLLKELIPRAKEIQRDKSAYISFLSTLLKDQPYVEMVYMTGILPIEKYSSGSELNMS